MYYLILLLVFYSTLIFSQDQTVYVFADKAMAELPGVSMRLPLEENNFRFDPISAMGINGNLLMTQTSPWGGTQSLLLRGSNSDQVQVTLDGAVINDPGHVGRGYNFAELNNLNLEEINIYYGPHATNLGAHAMSGAVELKSQKLDKPKIKMTAGSYETRGLFVGAPIKRLRGQFEVQTFEARGLSVSSNGDESDAVQNYRMKFNGELGKKQNWMLNYFIQGGLNKEEADFGSGSYEDDPNYYNKEKTFLPFFSLDSPNWGCVDQQLVWQQIYKSRDNIDNPDLYNSSTNHEYIKSRAEMIKLKMSLQCVESFPTTILMQWDSEQLNDVVYGDTPSNLPKQQQEFISVALLQDFTFSDNLKAEAQAKLDKWQEQNVLSSYRLATYHKISTEYSLKPSFSYAKKIPSLYQLYSSYGNVELAREQSWQADLTLHSVANQLSIFWSRTDQLIDFDSNTQKYLNIKSAQQQGIEIKSQIVIGPKWTALGALSYLDAKDRSQDLVLLLRPHWQSTLAVIWTKDDKLSAQLQGQYVGRRDDYPRISMPSYVVFNLLTAYSVNENLKTNITIKNILDKGYEMKSGYNTLGLSAFANLAYEY